MQVLCDPRAFMDYKKSSKTFTNTKKATNEDKINELLKENKKMIINEESQETDETQEVEEKAVSVDFSGISQEDRINARIGIICEKMKSGIDLSEKEMEFLKENSPGAYKRAVQIKKERAEFEEQMKRCKTKEQVEALMSKKDSTFMTNLEDAIDANNRSEAIKLTTIHNNLKDEHKQFTQTNEYSMKVDKGKEEDNLEDLVKNPEEEIDATKFEEIMSEQISEETPTEATTISEDITAILDILE